jgi:hypothetical protein
VQTCPICNSNIRFRKYLSDKGCTWYKCPSCKGAVMLPYLHESKRISGQELYFEYHNDQQFIERRKKFSVNQTNFLRMFYKENMIIIEIGPGLGFPILNFIKIFPNKSQDIFLMESEEFFQNHLKKQFTNTRVNIISSEANPGSIKKILKNNNNKPALIYMDNVLEHLEYPYIFLHELNSILPAGSILLIDVPNENLLRFRTWLYKKLGSDGTTAAAHINLFTKASLKMMAKKNGLKIKVWQRGIRNIEDVNCLPTNNYTSILLNFLKIFPIDKFFGFANNLRAAIYF